MKKYQIAIYVRLSKEDEKSKTEEMRSMEEVCSMEGAHSTEEVYPMEEIHSMEQQCHDAAFSFAEICSGKLFGL